MSDPHIFTETFRRIHALMIGLTDNERERMFESLRSAFCQHCGMIQELKQRCQCSNDE